MRCDSHQPTKAESASAINVESNRRSAQIIQHCQHIAHTLAQVRHADGLTVDQHGHGNRDRGRLTGRIGAAGILALQRTCHEGIVFQIASVAGCVESISTRPCMLSRRTRVSNCVPNCSDVSASEDKSRLLSSVGVSAEVCVVCKLRLPACC